MADLDVIEMNFQGDEIDCFMSIQEGGKGPWSNEINRIVTVGESVNLFTNNNVLTILPSPHLKQDNHFRWWWLLMTIKISLT